MLSLNQIFTAKPLNGKYHRGRVTEVQQNLTFAVNLYQFNEITARPTYLESLIEFPKTPQGIFSAHIRFKNNKWEFCKPATPMRDYHEPVLVNVHENFKWISGEETIFGKVKDVSTDPETARPLIRVAINDNPNRIRVFIFKNNAWVRHNLNPETKQYQELLPPVVGKATDFDLARTFRAEMSDCYAKGGSYT